MNVCAAGELCPGGTPPHVHEQRRISQKEKAALTHLPQRCSAPFSKSQVLHPSTRKLAAGALPRARGAARRGAIFPTWSRHNGATKYRNGRDTKARDGRPLYGGATPPSLSRPTAPPDSTSLRTATVVQRRHMAASMDHGGRTPFSPRRTARVGQQMAQQVARGRGAARM